MNTCLSAAAPLAHPVSRALLAERTYDIEFAGYLTNHAKHAVIALDRIEAPAERVQAYWNEYTRLTPYDLLLHKVDQAWDYVEPCNLEQWRKWRGRKAYWQEQVKFMQNELEGRFHGETNALVQHYGPDLLRGGLAGSLTHGIIHLGWAIDAQSPWMICEGLSYLNFCHIGVEPARLQRGRHKEDQTPMDSFLRIAETYHAQSLQEGWIAHVQGMDESESFHPELKGSGFQHEIAKVMSDPHPVATLLPAWLDDRPLGALWEEFYRAIAYLYLSTRDHVHGHGNFLVLHLLTSLWGLEHTCRVIDNVGTTRAALGQYFAVLVCFVCKRGFPTASDLRGIQRQVPPGDVDGVDWDWTAVVQVGRAEREEHNIKLVYVARALWRRYGRWVGFRLAAQAFTRTPSIGPEREPFGNDTPK